MRLLDRKMRKSPSGPSDVEASLDAYQGPDVYQPLMPGHEESRRRFAKDARIKNGMHPSAKSRTPTGRRIPASPSAADGADEVANGVITWDKLKKLLLPSILYQIGVITQGIGLRYTSASVNQMIGGSCIIFTAIFSVIFLQRNLNWRHWSGLLLAFVGVGVVSLASLQMSEPEIEINEWGKIILDKAPEFTPRQITYGIVMTVLSQVVGAAQMVWEEAYLQDLRLAPLQVMGWEGIWGLLLDFLLFMPLASILPGPDVGGVEENTTDTILMLARSPTIRTVSLIFLFTVAGTSQFGIIVSSRLGSVFRAVLLTARTAFIWLLDLVVFYNNIGPNKLGEGWSKSSPTRAGGFALLLAGTLLYARECIGVTGKVAGGPKKGNGGPRGGVVVAAKDEGLQPMTP